MYQHSHYRVHISRASTRTASQRVGLPVPGVLAAVGARGTMHSLCLAAGIEFGPPLQMFCVTATADECTLDHNGYGDLPGFFGVSPFVAGRPPCATTQRPTTLTDAALQTQKIRNKWWSHSCLSQRSFQLVPIFRLLLKVAVRGTHQCDFHYF